MRARLRLFIFASLQIKKVFVGPLKYDWLISAARHNDAMNKNTQKKYLTVRWFIMTINTKMCNENKRNLNERDGNACCYERFRLDIIPSNSKKSSLILAKLHERSKMDGLVANA